MRYTDPQTATLFQIGVSTTLYWLASPFYLEASYWSSPVLPLLAAIGLFRPLLSANLGMAGTRILGPTISSTLASTAPLFGVALGVRWADDDQMIEADRVDLVAIARGVALQGVDAVLHEARALELEALAGVASL